MAWRMAALCVLITLLLSNGLICQPVYDLVVPVLARRTVILHHGGMQQFKHHRFLGTHISCQGNTCATFQLELLVAGDVNPILGPEPNLQLFRLSLIAPRQSLLVLPTN